VKIFILLEFRTGMLSVLFIASRKIGKTRLGLASGSKPFRMPYLIEVQMTFTYIIVVINCFLN